MLNKGKAQDNLANTLSYDSIFLTFDDDNNDLFGTGQSYTAAASECVICLNDKPPVPPFHRPVPQHATALHLSAPWPATALHHPALHNLLQPGGDVTTEESLNSDATASHLLSNLNLHVASKWNISLPALSSLLFTDLEEKGYSLSSAMSAPVPQAASSSRKHGREVTSNKISSDFSTMSQSLLEQMWVAHKEKKANKQAWHELNLWHTKKKVHQHTSQHEHELLLLW